MVWSLHRQSQCLMCQSLKRFDGPALASLRGRGSPGVPAPPRGSRAGSPTLPSRLPFCCRAPGRGGRGARRVAARLARSPRPGWRSDWEPEEKGRGEEAAGTGGRCRGAGEAAGGAGVAAAPRPAALLWPHARGERGGAGLGKVSATGRGEGFLAQDCGFGSLGGVRVMLRRRSARRNGRRDWGGTSSSSRRCLLFGSTAWGLLAPLEEKL